MTRGLFYEDSHQTNFSARVLSCEPCNGGFDVVLDQTAFYPEGGGQPCDLGTLGGVDVTDVRERSGEIVHTCGGALEVGGEVAGCVDWERRFDLMQQHSGEHIVSGIIHRLYGYDNVGFHMGRDFITIDLSGELSDAQLQELERLANEEIWKNRDVLIHYPDEAALRTLDYRSKKELTGQVRLVEFPGTDLCACCGTHVKKTGEIGVIRLFSCVKFRGGVRVEMLCGRRCLQYLREIFEQNRQVSNLLSAKPLETGAAARRMADELGALKYRFSQLENRVFAEHAARLEGAGDTLLFEGALSPDALRRLAVAVGETCGGRVAVFSGADGAGYQYAVCLESGDLRALGKDLNAALDGRGGGKPNFIQGSVRASRAQITQFFEAR